MEKYLVLATFVGSIIALLFVVITAKKVLRFSEGTPLMQKISQSIRQGANACSSPAWWWCCASWQPAVC